MEGRESWLEEVEIGVNETEGGASYIWSSLFFTEYWTEETGH